MATTNTRIKKVRKALDLTQADFAKRIGSTANVLTHYETGRRNPSRSVINNICKEFHVNEEWLRTGSGEPFQPEPTDELDKLVTEYGLPQEFRALAEEFLDLKPSEQQVVVSFVRKLAAKLSSETAAEPAEPDAHALYEAEARAKAEAYYRELMQEREQTDEPSASPTIGADYGDLLA